MPSRFRQQHLARNYEKLVLQQGKGRLSGLEADYRPLFGITDFSSRGFRTAMRTWLSPRPLQVFSAVEYDACLYFHSRPEVVRIFDQVALDPRVTRAAARSLDVRHPAVAEGDIVMSTDFVLAEQHWAVSNLRAVAVKRDQDLTPRVLEKLAIEQAYWLTRGAGWTLVLDVGLPRVLVENMRQLIRWHDPARLPCGQSLIEPVDGWLRPQLTPGEPLETACSRSDRHFRLPSGTSLSISFHLMVRGKWPVDHEYPILPSPTFQTTDRLI